MGQCGLVGRWSLAYFLTLRNFNMVCRLRSLGCHYREGKSAVLDACLHRHDKNCVTSVNIERTFGIDFQILVQCDEANAVS